MRISYWPESVAQNGKIPYTAFLDSLHSAGYTLVKETMDADAAVIWSVLWHGRMSANQSVWKNYQSNHRPVIVLEVGCINRGTTWKVGLNGINRNAYFGAVGMAGTRAADLNLVLKPWQKEGEYILICGQHDRSQQWENQPPMSRWLMDTIETLQRHSNRDIILRPHPRCRMPAIENQYRGVYRQEPNHISGTYDDFDLTFKRAHAVVNWSSGPGVHAVLNGVPAFVGPDSLAYDVANHHLQHIEHPRHADRTQWLNDLAWTEYTVEEISSGLPLSRLRQTLETDVINAMI